jgi:hypothetical protein
MCVFNVIFFGDFEGDQFLIYVLLPILFFSALISNCRIGETGIQFLTDNHYSRNISNTDLKILRVTSFERATEVTKNVDPAPVFNSEIFDENGQAILQS